MWHEENGPMGTDLVLLDLGLPDGSGDEFLAHMEPLERIPVIVTSARHSEQERVRLLNMGADAYLVKPFSVTALLDCVRFCLDARLRHGDATAGPIWFGEVRIDLHGQCIYRDNRKLKLSPTEYHLLARLLRDAGKVVTDHQLLHDAMSAQDASRRDMLRLCMAQLRAKIEADPFEPKWLITVPGVGYQMVIPPGPP